MIISTSEAKIAVTSNNDAFGLKYQVDEAVTFIERGIRFHVYLNGEFDFDSHFYLRNRWNNQVSVFTDYRGRITRVGNVRIRYNSRGDVRRIGEGFRAYGTCSGVFTKELDGNNAITESSSNSPVAGFSMDATHTHTVSISGTTGDADPNTTATGGGNPVDILPPYYALCYIMKTS